MRLTAELVLNAFLISAVAGLATGVGGVIALIGRDLSMRAYDALLGFAAGVMVAIATLGLIHEGVTQGGTPIGLAGVGIGALALFALDRWLPHEHGRLPANSSNPLAYRRGLLLFSAMTLHNIPEGLGIGTSYAAQPRLGLLLAVAVALHNIPEGIALAAPFRASGLGALPCLGWTLGSGLVEPVGAVVGVVLASQVAPLLPFSLALAGGAMLYVVSDELIPESHSHGYEHEATLGFIVGFLLLLALMQLL